MRHEPHVRVQLFRGGGVPKEVHGEVKPRNIHGSLREVLPTLDVAARVRSAWQIHQDLDPHPRRCRLPWTDRHPRTISGLAALPTSLCKSPFNASHAAFRESEQCNGRSRMEPIAGARRCVTPTKRSDLLRERRLRCRWQEVSPCHITITRPAWKRASVAQWNASAAARSASKREDQSVPRRASTAQTFAGLARVFSAAPRRSCPKSAK